MSILHPIPAFHDNYIWLWQPTHSSQALVVDPGTAQPVIKEMQRRKLQLGAILITHHHLDHTGGIDELLAWQSAPVWGPCNPQITQITRRVRQGDHCEPLPGCSFSILQVAGHTLDHIAYYRERQAAESGILFCGDTLFAAGCGRLFEGDPDTMLDSLQRLADLPEDTRVCCAHEYTLANLKFAQAVENNNPALQKRCTAEQEKRERGLPTLPSTIALERATNPFLRCSEPEIKNAVCRHESVPVDAGPESVFASLRRWKDHF